MRSVREVFLKIFVVILFFMFGIFTSIMIANLSNYLQATKQTVSTETYSLIPLEEMEVNSNFQSRFLYYDKVTKNVYAAFGKDITEGITVYYYGNYPLRYDEERKILYYVDNDNVAHEATEDISSTFVWE